MKKLIIVCDEKYRLYGDYLAQLISMDDDTDETTVGTKDGEVAAQVWTEKDYNNNAAQMSSNQYVLFVGNSKLIKEKSSHMNTEFNKYGMKYGWLGKQAVLCVEKVVPLKQYDEFIQFALAYQENIKSLLTEEKSAGKVALPVALAAGALAWVAPIVAVPIATWNIIGMSKRNKKIEEQQYNCCTMKFYLDGLSKFLGM
ncbi:MAG: hypothetical protein IJO88_04370 [Oscillospiraceae bacterium]|nr:hypothetical protein [Oscillospiraceae bacterium]